MGELRLRSGATSRAARRVAIIVGVGVLLAAATGAIAAGAPSTAGENATASEDAEPQVLDASVHELDRGRAVLVVVVATETGTETVVTELDAEHGDPDRGGAESAPSIDEHPDTANLSGDGIENTSVGGVELSNESLDWISGDNLTSADGIASTTPNASPGGPDSPGAMSGDLIDVSLLDVPDALRSPPERLTGAVSREPAFGGDWLLPGTLAALGAAMATLGVGALAIWRRTI